MRNVADIAPEPYHIRFSAQAIRQATALAPAARARLSSRLIDLADLSAFAAGMSLSMSHIDRLIADVDGLSVSYMIDDRARTLTVMEITDESSGFHRRDGGLAGR